MGSFNDEEISSSTGTQPVSGCANCGRIFSTAPQFHQNVLTNQHSQGFPVDSISQRLQSTSLSEKSSRVRLDRPPSDQARCACCEAAYQDGVLRLPPVFDHSVVGLECVKRVEVYRCSACAVFIEDHNLDAHLSSDAHLRKMADCHK